MQTYADYERQQNLILKEKEKIDLECVSCPSCSSQWFEHVRVNMYQANHHVIIGQEVPEKPGTVGYVLLKCVRCQDYLEPRIVHHTRDIAGSDYDGFLDTLEGKGDSRKEIPTGPKDKSLNKDLTAQEV